MNGLLLNFRDLNFNFVCKKKNYFHLFVLLRVLDVRIIDRTKLRQMTLGDTAVQLTTCFLCSAKALKLFNVPFNNLDMNTPQYFKKTLLNLKSSHLPVLPSIVKFNICKKTFDAIEYGYTLVCIMFIVDAADTKNSKPYLSAKGVAKK